MLVFTIRRVIGSLLVLLVVSFITFMFTALTYDPLKPYTTHQPPLSQATLNGLRHQFHLDQPVLVRYWNWLRHLIHFDFGSWNFIRFNFGLDVQNTPVATTLASRLELTTKMIVGAIILATILAVVLGVISGVRHDKPFDVVATVLTFVLLALPVFWFAAVLKEGAIKINQAAHDTIFYTIGTETPGISSYGTSGEIFKDRMLHLVLPVVSLGLLTAAGWIRYQRASMIDVLDSDFMRLARAKGVRNRTVIRRHGLRNALIPLVTVMAIDIGALFGGAIITEQVFGWNAMGDYLNTAARRRGHLRRGRLGDGVGDCSWCCSTCWPTCSTPPSTPGSGSRDRVTDPDRDTDPDDERAAAHRCPAAPEPAGGDDPMTSRQTDTGPGKQAQHAAPSVPDAMAADEFDMLGGSRSQSREALRRFVRNPTAIVSLVVFAGIVIFSFVYPHFYRWDYSSIDPRKTANGDLKYLSVHPGRRGAPAGHRRHRLRPAGPADARHAALDFIIVIVSIALIARAGHRCSARSPATSATWMDNIVMRFVDIDADGARPGRPRSWWPAATRACRRTPPAWRY